MFTIQMNLDFEKLGEENKENNRKTRRDRMKQRRLMLGKTKLAKKAEDSKEE